MRPFEGLYSTAWKTNSQHPSIVHIIRDYPFVSSLSKQLNSQSKSSEGKKISLHIAAEKPEIWSRQNTGELLDRSILSD